jgi:type III pantothenate kinase
LLAIDVGNTNTVLGVFHDDTLECHWRIRSEHDYTLDEYAILFSNLLRAKNLQSNDIKDVIISCVVPPMISTL